MAVFQRGQMGGVTDHAKRAKVIDRLYGGTAQASQTSNATAQNVRPPPGLGAGPSLRPGGLTGSSAPRTSTGPLTAPVQSTTAPSKADAYDAARDRARQVQQQQAQTQAANLQATDGANAFTDLAALRREQERERAAADNRLRAARSEALGNAEARANLSGFGLAAGTSNLLGDVTQAQDNSAILELAALRQQQRGEQTETLKNQANLYDLEETSGIDFDGDGKVAGRPVAEVKAEEDEAGAVEGKLAAFENVKGKLQQNTAGAPWETPGSQNRPYVVPAEGDATMRNLGTLVEDMGGGRELWQGPDGQFYLLGGS